MTRTILLGAALLLTSTPTLLGAPPAPTTPPAPAKGASPDARIAEELFLTDLSTQVLRLPEGLPEHFEVVVARGAKPATLVLDKYSLRSPDFMVVVQDASGALSEADAPPVRTYRGFLKERPDVSVRASLDATGLRAFVAEPDADWAIQPATDADPGAPAGLHAIYNEADVRGPDFRCGVPDDVVGSHAGDEPSLRGTTGRENVEIAFDADVEFYQINGSSVSNTVADIEGLLNGIEALYESQVNIAFEVTLIVVRTAEADPYSSANASTLLDQFDSQWEANFKPWAIYDVAHLLTGKNLGTTIGIAFTPSVCPSGFTSPYGLSESRYSSNATLRRSLTAHEVGHNFNALHCNGESDCRIMCASNGGCGTPTTFGASARTRIMAYAGGRSCLSNEELPLAVPVLERWTSTTLDASRWWFSIGSEIRNAPGTPPSAPFALALNAANANDYRDDETRLGFVNLVGVSSPRLTFFARHLNMDADDRLVVEAWLSSNRWAPISTLSTATVPNDDYAFISVPLSGLTVHAESRIRFRSESDSLSEFWYVDDVFVGTDPGQPGACCLGAGQCTITIEASCVAQGGTFAGEGTTCVAGCSPTGVCCLPVPGTAPDCFTGSNADCFNAGGFFIGTQGQCSSCDFCPCDWNLDSNINDQDFFDWSNDFFTGSGPVGAGDYNNDGAQNDQDFFDFVNCFFSPAGPGC